jgi:hypothetical protein
MMMRMLTLTPISVMLLMWKAAINKNFCMIGWAHFFMYKAFGYNLGYHL